MEVDGLAAKYPLLKNLDLRANKIYALNSLDKLKLSKKLLKLNIDKNPIMIHLHIEQMATNTMPQLEVFNNRRVRELGHKYTHKIERLRKQLSSETDPKVIAEIEEQIRKIDDV